MKAFKTLVSKSVFLAEPNIDTDQIIPARFLKTTARVGLGQFAFADWRFDGEGRATDSVLNRVQSAGAEILVAGHNFGCGSSREHAPWALLDFGFRAVISTGIADIFRNNALKNGLLAIEVDPSFHQELTQVGADPVRLDLEQNQVVLSSGCTTTFEIDPFARYCLLKGMDSLDVLLDHQPHIAAYEESLS